MSSKIQEKEQQKDNKRDLEADDIFNQQLFRTLAYAGAGFGAGLVASVFLKNRKALSLIGAGTGAAYGYNGFMSELNQFNKFKDYANQSQQSNTLKREDQATKNWDQFMPKEENISHQKRFGGSDDDSDNKERKSESKSRDNKGGEQKGHEATGTKPKTQAKSPSESQYTSGGKQEKTQSNKKESDKKEGDKSSQQQAGSQKPKSSTPSPKESNKNQEQQQKGESQKNVSQGREQQKVREGEKNLTAGSEHKTQNRGGQHLQEFKTNPGPGKPAPGEDQLHRGAERNTRGKNEIDERNDQQTRMVKQDANYRSTRTGNKMKVEPTPENTAGGQFGGKSTAGSQVNAVIE